MKKKLFIAAILTIGLLFMGCSKEEKKAEAPPQEGTSVTGQAMEKTKELSQTVVEEGKEAAHEMTEKAAEMAEEVKGEAAEMAGEAKEKAAEMVEETKEGATALTEPTRESIKSIAPAAGQPPAEEQMPAETEKGESESQE